MYIEVKSSAGISLIPVETRHFSKRRVHLRGEITMDTANALDDAIALLNDESTTEPIDLYITSGGGDTRAGQYIYDIITSPGCAPIRAHAQGIVASMATVIFAAAASRDLLPGTRLMIHQPLLGGPVQGNATDIRTISEELLATREKMDNLLAKHSGRTLEEVREKTSRDSWFTAQEAVDFGLADRICTYAEMMNFGRK